MSERDFNKHTPEGLLRWSVANSNPEEIKNVDKAKLMTHEEFKELWETAFPDEIKVLKENVKVLENKPEKLEDLHLALDKVLYIVEGIDQADWFADLNGFEIVLPYLRDPNTETRMAAAWIISNALQNNPKVQDKFLKKIGMQKILDTLDGEDDEKPAKRKVGMISSAIRSFVPLREQFYSLNGFKKIIEITEKFPVLFSRLCWTVGSILDEENLMDKTELAKINMKEYLLSHKKEIDDDELLQTTVSRL